MKNIKKVIIDGIEYVPINSVKETEKQVIKKNVHFELYPKDSSKQMTWHEAMDYCKSLGEGWRLPTVSEMFYIYEEKFITNAFYWSSTENDFNVAWYFFFGNGNASYTSKTNALYVRAIRNL